MVDPGISIEAPLRRELAALIAGAISSYPLMLVKFKRKSALEAIAPWRPGKEKREGVDPSRLSGEWVTITNSLFLPQAQVRAAYARIQYPPVDS